MYILDFQTDIFYLGKKISSLFGLEQFYGSRIHTLRAPIHAFPIMKEGIGFAGCTVCSAASHTCLTLWEAGATSASAKCFQ